MIAKQWNNTHDLKRFIKRSVVLCFAGTGLVGCSSHTQEEFDCPAGKGIGCKSITEIKKKLNQGEIDIPETTMEAAIRQSGGRGVAGYSMMPPVIGQIPVPGKPVAGKPVAGGDWNSLGSMAPISVVDSNGLVIQRIPEQPLRVWIAPYQDQDGNLREASVVHTVIKQGSWQLSPGI